MDPDVYFWRDSAGHEVELVIDQGKVLVPVEIKSGQTVGGDFFKGLDYWRSLPGQDGCRAALVYGGDSSYIREAVAVTSWEDWG